MTTADRFLCASVVHMLLQTYPQIMYASVDVAIHSGANQENITGKAIFLKWAYAHVHTSLIVDFNALFTFDM